MAAGESSSLHVDVTAARTRQPISGLLQLHVAVALAPDPTSSQAGRYSRNSAACAQSSAWPSRRVLSGSRQARPAATATSASSCRGGGSGRVSRRAAALAVPLAAVQVAAAASFVAAKEAVAARPVHPAACRWRRLYIEGVDC